MDGKIYDLTFILISTLSLLVAVSLPFIIIWWKARPRVDFGLLKDNKISNKITVSRRTVTPITFRFKNKTKKRLRDLYFDIEIWRPLRLSDTNRALGLFTGEEGRTLVVRRDDEVFHIKHIIELAPRKEKDISIELHTEGNNPDIYSVDMAFSSPQHNFKRKVLKIEIV